MDRIEAGEGFTEMPFSAVEVVAMARGRGLEVQFELGGKHSGAFTGTAVEHLIDQGRRWLDAGALRLVVEARVESAQGVGLFDSEGNFNARFADRFAAAFGHEVLVFEAPEQAKPVCFAESFRTERPPFQRAGSRNCCASKSTVAGFTRMHSRTITCDPACPLRRRVEMAARVVIDCFPASVKQYVADHVIVVVDVIRATTTAVTSVTLVRPLCRRFGGCGIPDCREAPESSHGRRELGGTLAPGFEINNSPSELADRSTSIGPPCSYLRPAPS